MPRAPLIAAHRAGALGAPGNTMRGCQEMVALNVDMIELDIHRAADGTLVIAHDHALNKDLTTDMHGTWLDAPGPVIEKATWADLSMYRVGRVRPGSHEAAQHPHAVNADLEHLPRLEDVMDLVLATGAKTRLLLDLKNACEYPDLATPAEPLARDVLDLVRAKTMVDNVIISAFDWRALDYVSREEPGIRTAYLTFPMADVSAIATPTQAAMLQRIKANPSIYSGDIDVRDFGPHLLRSMAEAGAYGWNPYRLDVTQDLVDMARNLGLSVAAWTVNTAEDAARFADWGVDTLITDQPSELRTYFADRTS